MRRVINRKVARLCKIEQPHVVHAAFAAEDIIVPQVTVLMS